MTKLDGLGFAVDPLDRLSYRREDADDVARLRARDEARAQPVATPILIAGGLVLAACPLWWFHSQYTVSFQNPVGRMLRRRRTNCAFREL